MTATPTEDNLAVIDENVPPNFVVPATEPARLFSRVLVGAVAALVAVFCLLLGMWQWDRAHAQAREVAPDPRVPLSEVMQPSRTPAQAQGRLVSVSGDWLHEPPRIVPGREVAGQDAMLLVQAFQVFDGSSPAPSGTLAVIRGWLPAGAEVVPLPPLPVAVSASDAVVTFAGRVWGSEGAVLTPPSPVPPGFTYLGSLSTATLAQDWPGPLYSAVVAAEEAPSGWLPLPTPEPEQRIDFRSVTYAAEWWLFGLFGLFLAGKWIKDNTPAAARAKNAA